MRWNTGAAYPAIERSVPLSILVPDPGPDVIQELGTTLHRCAMNFEVSQALITAASKAITSLIDGSLDETELLEESADIESWLRQNPSSTATGRS
jgi:type I restriction enzyme S subunit